MTENKAIGFLVLKAGNLMLNCGIEDTFNITFENVSAGTIKIKSHFVPEGGENWADKLERYETELKDNKRKHQELVSKLYKK
jgi:hypothetical protein